MAKCNFIKLHPKTLSRLQAIIDNPSSNTRHVQRAKVILWWHQGKNFPQTMEELQVPHNFITRWRNRFASKGIKGLTAQTKFGGRPTGPGRRKPPKSKMSSYVLKKLRFIANDPKADPRDVKKALLILLWNEGKSYGEIKTALNTNDRFIGLWRKRFTQNGIRGLKDQPRKGGRQLRSPSQKSTTPIYIPAAQLQQLKAIVKDRLAPKYKIKKAKAILMWHNKKSAIQTAKKLGTSVSNVQIWKNEFKKKLAEQ